MAQSANSTDAFRNKMTLRHLLTSRYFWLVVGLALATVALLLAMNQGLFSMAANNDGELPLDSLEKNETVPILCAVQLKFEKSYTTQTYFTAEVVPSRTADLTFQRAGRITEVLVDEGTAVKKDQVIAKLDHRHLDARKTQLEAELKQATSVLDELRQGPRGETIRAARAQVQDINQQLLREQKRLERSNQLIEQNAISTQQHEQTLFGVKALEAKLELADSQLDELLAGTRVEKLDAQTATVNSIEAGLKSLEYDLEDCKILAPFEGLISKRMLDEGSTINPGSTVCQLIENGSLEIHAGLPLDVGSQLSEGDKVDLLISTRSGSENKSTATVESIVRQLDLQTRTIKVILKADVKTTDANIVAGQTVRLGFDRQNDSSGFWISTKSITSDHRGLWSCYIFRASADSEKTEGGNDGIVRRQSIEVLYDDNDRAFVRGTLNEGDWLVSEGVHRLSDRQRVRIKRITLEKSNAEELGDKEFQKEETRREVGSDNQPRSENLP